ncbi:TonB-dependent receptor [Peijinzhouia sedimentorum]
MKYPLNKPRIQTVFVFILAILFYSFSLQAQEVNDVFGKVINSFTGTGIEGVNITIKESIGTSRTLGFTTNKQGEFSFFSNYPRPFTLVVTSVGYKSKELTVTEQTTKNLFIQLEPTEIQLDEIVTIGQKVEQSKLIAPMVVERLGALEIMQTASISVFDAIGNLRGVDVTTQSMVLSTVNTRGFNSTANTRFIQLSDGIDNQAPGLNFSLGNVAGIPDIDIESVELIPGPNSAMYGSGNFNGVLNTNSKNPFDYQGFSLSLKNGISGMESGGDHMFDFGGYPLREGAFRYAKALNDKLAFKLTGSILSSTDFSAQDYSNIGVGLHYETLRENPGYNGLNTYGDEISSLLPIGPNDSLVVVNRTGYKEEDLVDYDIDNVRVLGSIHYKFTTKTTLILQGNYGSINTMLTGDNRISLRDFSIAQGKAELKGEKFNLKGYFTSQNAGNSFDAGLLAANILRASKPDDAWFEHFTYGMRNTFIGGSYIQARQVANSAYGPYANYEQQFDAGTAGFDSVKSVIANSAEPGFGAKIIDRSKLYNVDGTYLFDKLTDIAEITVGSNFRYYQPTSEGTIFTDTTGNDLSIYEYGGFIQAFKNIPSNNLYLTASLRYDKNENFKGQFNPRLSIVHSYKSIHNLRLSFASGVRFPSVREQFYNQDLRDKRLVGGLENVITPFGLPNNAFSEQGVTAFNEAVLNDITLHPNFNPEPISQRQAYLKNLPLLEGSIVRQDALNGLKPEKINTIELGYKSLFENRRYIDITIYRNYYSSFIGVMRLVKTRTSPEVDLYASAFQVNSGTANDRYFVFANSNSNITSQGIEATYDVTSKEGFNFGINATYTELIKSNEDDPIVPSFNTPKFKTNVTLGHRRVTDELGFSFVFRIRSEFLWESAFADGIVPDFKTLDLQVTYKLPKIRSALKAGGMNVFNERFVNAYGGPQVASIWHITYTFDPYFYR